ncbi:uncharacterized protein KY384_004003 [Bacidia gigantensis]|uniref:uncharacterized protein n=1 Tax=Bacidia gigantensis TaxID=2732470 RepID=UPI001D04BFC7|nr:uncharacterized protein KY384_004003 [Bacidia gigantensis]KAG8530648.1 hypothetical protein KY384_004003 [Bacidia gigantensis]
MSAPSYLPPRQAPHSRNREPKLSVHLKNSTIVASIMRLVYFFQVSNLDPTYTLTPIAFTTAAEQFLGIICPSLPTLAPIIRVTWEITSSLGSARSKPTSNYSDSKMAPPDKWAQSNNGGRSRKGSSASWWRRGSAKRAPDESDETLAKKASGEALFFNGQPFTNEHQTITSKRLDPRFADLEMGTTTDAVRSISGDETLDDGESGKHGFEGLPSGAIGVKQGFKVEDK